MITVKDVESTLPDYTEFAHAFGENGEVGGDKLLNYLGVEAGLYEWMHSNAPTREMAAGWLFGFSFALWYLNTKLNMVVESEGA